MNRKKDVRELADVLKKAGLSAGQIHGDMEQGDRIRELDRFKSGAITVLVASDVAARGLDVPGVSHVINYDVPHHAEDYVHRIGRTGRAGLTGIAYTLFTPEEADNLHEVEKLIGHKVPRHGASAAVPDEVEDAAETIAVPTDALPARDAAHDQLGNEVPADAVRPRRRRGGRGRKPAGASAASSAPTITAPQHEPERAEPRYEPEPRRAEREPRRDARPSRDDRSRDDRSRDDRRDRDDGPSEVGFGNEIPAFMLVRATA